MRTRETNRNTEQNVQRILKRELYRQFLGHLYAYKFDFHVFNVECEAYLEKGSGSGAPVLQYEMV